jgi:hypothetical protein
VTSRSRGAQRRAPERQDGPGAAHGNPGAGVPPGSRARAQLGGPGPGWPRHGLAAWHQGTRVEVPAQLRRDLVIGAGAPLLCDARALEDVAAHADHDVRLVGGLVVEGGRPWFPQPRRGWSTR